MSAHRALRLLQRPDRLLYPPLPTSTVTRAAWLADVGSSNASWVAYVGGYVVPSAGGNPQTNTEPVLRRIRVQGRKTGGARSYQANGLGTIVPIATRPWTFHVFKYRAANLDGVNEVTFAFGTAAHNAMQIRQLNNAGQTQLQCSFNNGATIVLGTIPVDTTRIYTAQTFLDGVTNANLIIDNSSFVTATVAATLVNSDSIGIGSAASSLLRVADVDHYFHLITAAKPTAAEIAALRDWAHIRYGTLAA